jgi:hypothetical protein
MPSGVVTLISAIPVASQFRFRGTLTANEIVGQVQWIRVETGAVAESSEMRIRRIAPRLDAAAAGSTLEGIYSSIEYHERTGDVGGLELALVPDSDSIVAILWEYQGAPARPEAPARILTSGDTLRLHVPGADGLPARDYLFLRSGDMLSYRGAVRVERLVRRSSVWEALREKPRYSCR